MPIPSEHPHFNLIAHPDDTDRGDTYDHPLNDRFATLVTQQELNKDIETILKKPLIYRIREFFSRQTTQK